MKVSLILRAIVIAAGLAFPVAAQDAHSHADGDNHSHAEGEAPVAAVETPDYIKGGIVFGDATAPIEIIEYGSMTCPHCKLFMDEIAVYLQEDLIPSGKVRLVFRNFVRDQLDLAVSVATRCTNDPEVSRTLLETYFEKQVAWATSQDPKSTIFAIAAAGGVENDTLEQCLQSREIFEHVVGIAREGHEKYQIKSTPTVIMNGKKVDFHNYDDLKAQIDAAVEAQ